MKKIQIQLLLCTIIILRIDIKYTAAQNLILNSGFEIHDTCPDYGGLISNSLNWLKAENTPDFFHTCSPPWTMNVPHNIAGFQYAHSGCAYAGFYVFAYQTLKYREYFSGTLDTALVPGTKYHYAYYVSLFNGWLHNKLTAVNRIGFKLSTQPFTTATDSSPATDNNPTCYTDSIIADTANWVRIEGSFIADSAYRYITFGNFFDSLHIQYTILHGGPTLESYYYIDDICLSPDSLSCISVTDTCRPPTPAGLPVPPPSAIKIFPNPFDDWLQVHATGAGMPLELILYDLSGRSLMHEQFNGSVLLPAGHLLPGFYSWHLLKNNTLLQSGKLVKVRQ